MIDELRAQTAETPLVEFKENNDNPAVIGRLISGISNAARIAGKDAGYVVWGVRDADHAVVGTTFDPDTAKTLRNRFGVAAHNSAQISGVICSALNADLTAQQTPTRPRSGYAPF